jgi:hypothetical protein
MRRVLSFCFASWLVSSFAVHAQVSITWTARYSGRIDPTNNQDIARAIAVDAAGNACVTGTTYATATGGEGQLPDTITIKYDSTGATVWSRIWGTALAGEYPTDIEVDGTGNVYVYASETATSRQELALIKYNSSGAEQWVRRFTNATPAQMTVDSAGNIYLTGVASQQGTSQVVTYQFLTLKYDSAGSLLWSRTHSVPGAAIVASDFSCAVAVNSAGQVYATGVLFTQTGASTFTLKYDADGTFLWSAAYPSSTYAQRIALDGSGNVYVGATGRDSSGNHFLVLKYNPAGSLLWSGTYAGFSQFDNNLTDIAVDSLGNVVLTGNSSGAASHDIVTARFTADGTRQWVSRYNNESVDSGETARGVAIDSSGFVYVAGYTYGGASQHDFLALKYDANGNQKWVFKHDEAGGPDFVSDFALGPGGTVFLAGYPYYLDTGYDMLAGKLEQLSINGLPEILAGPQDIEVIAGQPVTFAVSVQSPSPVTYQWRLNGRDLPGATQQSISLAGQPSETGEYSVRVSNAVGVTATPEARLTVRRPPTVTISTTTPNVVEGRTVVLSGFADGDQPMRFQWRFNGSDLIGQTNQQLRLTAVTTNNTGSHTLVARNPWGDAMSNPVQINVSPRGAIDRWTWRSPLPQGNELTDIAYGNGRYVAVGVEGTVVVSTNGRDWSLHTAEYGTFTSIVYGDGLFAAVADGLLNTSTDGVTWTNRVLPTAGRGQISWLAFGAGRFVGVGTSVVSSDDGISWIEHTNIPPSGYPAVTYGNGLFVVSAYNGTLTSTNGIDWVHYPIGGAFPSLAAGNGVFVAHNYGQILLSTNGIDWESVLTFTDGNYFDGVRFANGQFYALGTKLLTSSDGRNWTERMSEPEGGMRLTSAVGGPGQTIVVGDEGRILVSTDGTTFAQVGGGTRNNLRAIVYANNRFTVVGNDGVIWNSIDGEIFAEVGSSTTNNLRAIAFGNDHYIVVGDAGTILTSRDAIAWQAVDLVTNDLYGIVFANGHFTVVGELGRVLVTTNLQDWTLTFAGTGRRLQGIAYGGGRYVATGQQGYYAVSTNAVHWQAGRNESMGYMESIVYTNDLFVAVGSNGRIFTSPDGAQWTYRMTGNGQELESIIYVLGRFIAAGDRGTIMTSTNAVDWVEHRFLTRNSFRQVIYARGALWAVGNNEMIVKSGQLQPYVTLGSGPLSGRLVQVLAEPGQIVELHASSDLRDWQTLSSGPASAEGTFTHIDPTISPQRFYRAFAP